MIHQGLLVVHGNSKDGFVFLDRAGTEVEASPEPAATVSAMHTALAAPPATGDAHKDNLLHRFLMVGARRRIASIHGHPELVRGPDSGPDSAPNAREFDSVVSTPAVPVPAPAPAAAWTAGVLHAQESGSQNSNP